MLPQRTQLTRAIRLGVLEATVLVLGLLFVRREVWQLRAAVWHLDHWQQEALILLSFVDGLVTGLYSLSSKTARHQPAYGRMIRFAAALFLFLYVACSSLCERLTIGVFTSYGELIRTTGVALVLAGIGLRIWSQLSATTAGRIEPDQSIQAGSDLQSSAVTIDLESEQPQPPAGTANLEPEQQGRSPIPEKKHPTQVDLPSDSLSAATTDQTSLKSPDTSVPQDIGAEQIGQQGPHKWIRHPTALGRLISLVGLSLTFNCWLPLIALPGVVILLKWHLNDQESFLISQLGRNYVDYRKKTWSLIPFIY